jgi:hypothetical protein
LRPSGHHTAQTAATVIKAKMDHSIIGSNVISGKGVPA